VRDAAAGLSENRREALDLTLRHGLDEPDLATVLGVSTKRAAGRVTAARTALDQALDTLLIARAGHGECAALDRLLAGWDGLFTKSVHERVSSHVAECQTCATGSRQGDAADLFVDLPAAPPPPLLLERLIANVAVPDRVTYRGEIAEPFRRSGFPVPLTGSQGRRRAVAWAAALAVVALVAGFWYAFRSEQAVHTVGSPAGPLAGAQEADVSGPTLPRRTVPTPTPSPSSPSPTPTPSASPTPSPSPSRPSGSPSQDVTASRASRAGTGRKAQIDALLADSTVGCPRRWRATVTSYVSGNTPRSVSVYWGRDETPSRRMRMRETGGGLFQAELSGLPVNVTVYWKVVVVTVDGMTSSTPVSPTRHERRC
jgi:hypothetical protein